MTKKTDAFLQQQQQQQQMNGVCLFMYHLNSGFQIVMNIPKQEYSWVKITKYVTAAAHDTSGIFKGKFSYFCDFSVMNGGFKLVSPEVHDAIK